ncbi:MAG: cysteine--tRNA ligase [Desulfobulbaceae bacterium]|nr:cysteine--tRNA ligase [Desulfobulbaceae bacterium]
MSLKIYDSKSGQKVPFVPLTEGQVKMYVCGITAYDYCHIGHARSALIFDMIVNYLRYSGYKVTYVRNFTDIDDKIINRANEQGTTSEELANRFIQEFYTDMNKLGVGAPDIEPKATEHLPEIIGIINELIDKGLAYQAGNDVYFAVDKFPQYGALSGRNLDDLQAGARIMVNEIKNNPMDFALWKGGKPGEPTWDSPWGPGRPGWHIECSAMSRKYLGNTFDIHGGGEDLVFPHHENEVAQSEGASGAPFVKHWIHHAFVTISNEKMSKSLHNFLTIRDVLEEHHPEALRLMVFSTHYRHPLDFSDGALKDAQSGANRLYSCLADCNQLPEGQEGAKAQAKAEDIDFLGTLSQRFCEAMDNDFNTAQALGVLFEGVKAINRIRQSLAKKPAKTDISLLQNSAKNIAELAGLLGLLRQDPADFFAEQQAQHLKSIAMSRDDLQKLIEERLQARAQKDWSRADQIRDDLLAKQIELKDGPHGTTWKVASN